MLVAFTALFMSVALAQEKPALKPEEGPGNYALCLETARSYPQQGLELAQRWQTLDGGEPAKHCEAVALIGLHRYPEAAKDLEALAITSKQSETLRAGLLAQAAQAWTLDGDLAHAEEAQTAALKLMPQGSTKAAPILIDRAVTYGELKRYDEALADLNAALVLEPKNAEALAFRANAHRGLNQLDAALKDAIAAVALEPTNTNALLERGIAYRLTGNAPAARADWEKVIALEPGGDAARAAKGHLDRIDVPVEGDAKPAPAKKKK